MRHAQSGNASGSSLEVRIAAGMVGAGALLGVVLLAAAGLLFTADPGFLFAVLPAIIGAALFAGFQLVLASVSLSRRLLKHTPGARLQTAVIGGCLFLSGLFGCTIQPAMGLPLACYGAALGWLMTTAAAARDLGPWWTPLAARPATRNAWFMRRSTSTPRPQRTWIELWQEGLSRPFPVPDLAALCIALLAFAVGDVLLLVGLFGRNALLPLAIVLIGSAIAVVALLERRLKARLGYA